MKPDEIEAKRAELKRLILTLPPADKLIVLAALRAKSNQQEQRQ